MGSLSESLTRKQSTVLKYIAKHGLAGPDEIGRKFWTRLDTHNHFTLLRQLTRLGLIERLFGDSQALLGYRLTRKGLQTLSASGEHCHPAGTRASYRTTFEHDTIVRLVREIVESSPLVSSYCSEPVVRSILAKRHGHQEKRDERYKVPDALFILKTERAELKVALEVEIADKSEERCRKLFRLLVTSSDWDVVFLIVKENKSRLRLEQIRSDVRQKDALVRLWREKNGIYFASLEDILKLGLTASLTGEGKTFSLKSLEAEMDEKRHKV
ncbi:MAG: hypothetical protein HY537_00795 [Deltaproteobacteria bacterium]|nr:hypothetical protein [Deltaproteobacteria bacterium]